MFDPDLLHNYQHPTPVLHLSCTKHTLSWLYGCHSNWAHSVLLTLCVLTKSTHKILFYFIYFFWQSFTSFSVFTISRNSSSNPVLQGLAAFFFFFLWCAQENGIRGWRVMSVIAFPPHGSHWCCMWFAHDVNQPCRPVSLFVHVCLLSCMCTREVLERERNI